VRTEKCQPTLFLGVEQFVKALRVIALAQQAGGWGADPSAVTNEALEKALVAGTLPMATMHGLEADVEDNRDGANNPFNMSGMGGGLPGAGGLGGASTSFGAAAAAAAAGGWGGGGGGGGGGGSNTKSKINAKQATSIVDSLKEIYKAKVRPLEEALKFGSFYSPLLTDGGAVQVELC
jgi:hypothetical protein